MQVRSLGKTSLIREASCGWIRLLQKLETSLRICWIEAVGSWKHEQWGDSYCRKQHEQKAEDYRHTFISVFLNYLDSEPNTRASIPLDDSGSVTGANPCTIWGTMVSRQLLSISLCVWVCWSVSCRLLFFAGNLPQTTSSIIHANQVGRRKSSANKSASYNSSEH